MLSQSRTKALTSLPAHPSIPLPVLRVHLVLPARVEPHEHVVADLVALGQRQPSRVQALEDQLGVVVPVERDVDGLELPDGLEQGVHRHPSVRDPVAEEPVVDPEGMPRDRFQYLLTFPLEKRPSFAFHILIHIIAFSLLGGS